MHSDIYKLLLESPDEGNPARLLRHVFPGSGEDTEFGRNFLHRLLSDDARFSKDSDSGDWKADTDNHFSRDFSRVPFVVVDLEGTGNSPGRGGVTEVGAVSYTGGEITGRFEQLVNPGSPIPPYVSRITGITDEMVADKPPFAEVLADFVEFAGDAVLVAHNAAFDVTVLDTGCRQLLGRSLDLPYLCTVELARRTWPELRRVALDYLTEHFELKADDRHRALADAEVTAGVLGKFVEDMRGRGVSTIEGALALLDEEEPRPRHEINVSQQCLEALPRGPGCFRMIDAGGDALYVSRSDNVAEAVLPWFVGAPHLSDRQMGMAASTRDVVVKAAGSETEAAMIEAEHVRRYEPTYNRGSKHLPRPHFLRVTLEDEFPAVYVAPRLRADRSLYLGPFGTPGLAEEAARLFAARFGLRTCAGELDVSTDFKACELKGKGRCSSPCDETVDSQSYAQQVQEFRAALDDDAFDVEEVLGKSSRRRSRRSSASRIARVHRKQPLQWYGQHFLAVLPALDGGRMVYAVAWGRLASTFTLRAASDVEKLEKWFEALGSEPPDGRMMGKVAVSTSILADWAVKHGGRDGSRDGESMLRLDLSDPGTMADACRQLRAELAA